MAEVLEVVVYSTNQKLGYKGWNCLLIVRLEQRKI